MLGTLVCKEVKRFEAKKLNKMADELEWNAWEFINEGRYNWADEFCVDAKNRLLAESKKLRKEAAVLLAE